MQVRSARAAVPHVGVPESWRRVSLRIFVSACMRICVYAYLRIYVCSCIRASVFTHCPPNTSEACRRPLNRRARSSESARSLARTIALEHVGWPRCMYASVHAQMRKIYKRAHAQTIPETNSYATVAHALGAHHLHELHTNCTVHAIHCPCVALYTNWCSVHALYTLCTRSVCASA